MPLFDPPENIAPLYHRCDFLPKEGIDVVYSLGGFGDRNSCWTLTMVREATESDLEQNHMLDEVGESIWTVTAEILHCPYCGFQLPEIDLKNFIGFDDYDPENDVAENQNESSFGIFSLFDQENWSGKLR